MINDANISYANQDNLNTVPSVPPANTGRITASPSLMMSLDSLEGETISGRYRIIKRIGKGGMGVVYLAQQTNLGRNVCIKVLNPALLDDEDAVGRFEREAHGLSRLQHPNIVTIFDYGRDGNLAYIVMEYAQGITLSKYLKANGALPQDDFLPIAVQTLKGIGEAHKLGLIHRDIKPANIILGELEGEKNFVKILDFGLAKLAQGGEDLTRDQQLVGSASYMAPEQILSGKSDTCTDVYALGVMFYFMLSGKKPFTGPNDNVILYKHVNEVPAPLISAVPQPNAVSEGLCAVIDQCLDKDPQKRPQNAIDLLRALSSALDAPQLNASYSSLSVVQTELLKANEDAETRMMSGHSISVSASSTFEKSPDSLRLEDTSAVSNKMTAAPASISTSLMAMPAASAASSASRDRKFLIPLLLISAIVATAIVTIIVVNTRPADNTALVTSSDSTDEDNSTASEDNEHFQAIREQIAEQNWPVAENLLAAVAAKKGSDNLDVIELRTEIRIGKTLSEAETSVKLKNYSDAVQKYQEVLAKSPNNKTAIAELQRIDAALPKITFSFENEADAKLNLKLYIDNEEKGPISNYMSELKLDKFGRTSIIIKGDGREFETSVGGEFGEEYPIVIKFAKTNTNAVRKPAAKDSESNQGSDMLAPSSKKPNSGTKPAKGSGLLL